MLYISFLVAFKLYHYNCVRINRILLLLILQIMSVEAIFFMILIVGSHDSKRQSFKIQSLKMLNLYKVFNLKNIKSCGFSKLLMFC